VRMCAASAEWRRKVRGREVERWRGGEVERWRGGEVERWRGGEVERWSGEVERYWRPLTSQHLNFSLHSPSTLC